MTRVLLRIMAAALLLVVSGLICWRVLAPAELSASARTPTPPTPSAMLHGVTSRLNVAPLVVDGTVRVYAAKHQVRADGPVTARAVYTARWSFRRWPEQLSAVVASGTTVVTRWSDGKLVAIDARNGTEIWRADGPEAPDYAGHRTGATAVWNPPGLRAAAGTVVVTEGQTLSGYAVSTGQSIWTTAVPPGCVDGFTTGTGAYLCATGAYDTTTGAALTGWPAAPYAPVGCETEGCAAFRDAAGQGWLVDPAGPRRVAALDDPLATLVAGTVVTASSSQSDLPSTSGSPTVTPGPDVSAATPPASGASAATPGPGASSATASTAAAPPTVPAGDSPSSFFAAVAGRTVDGAALWTTPGPVRVLGGNAGVVLLLRPDNTLDGVDALTGALRFSYPLLYGPDKEDTLDWKPGLYHVTDGFLAVERLNRDAPDDPESPIYYLTLDTVLLVALPG